MADVYASFNNIILRLCNHQKLVFCICLKSGEKQYPKCVLTEKRLDDIRQRIKANQCYTSKSPVLRGLQMLKCHPFIMSVP